MTKLHFYIVDVFAEEKYSGNQLAVFLTDKSISSETMQTIAAETNFSETTFILSTNQKDGGYDVRIFTPREEMPFAGHPTLGTAYVIQHKVQAEPTEKVVLNLAVGQIPVTFDGAQDKDGLLWMAQNEPDFGDEISVDVFKELLGLKDSDFDLRFPIQQVSTGFPHFIIPLKNLDALKKARLSEAHYWRLLETSWAKNVMPFCPQGYHTDHDLSVRMFSPFLGIAEDPATGSGNGCLAAYLAKHNFFGTGNLDLQVAQGYEINRPSRLFIRSNYDGQRFNISVGGKVVEVAEGDFV